MWLFITKRSRVKQYIKVIRYSWKVPFYYIQRVFLQQELSLLYTSLLYIDFFYSSIILSKYWLSIVLLLFHKTLLKSDEMLKKSFCQKCLRKIGRKSKKEHGVLKYCRISLHITYLSKTMKIAENVLKNSKTSTQKSHKKEIFCYFFQHYGSLYKVWAKQTRYIKKLTISTNPNFFAILMKLGEDDCLMR